MLRSRIHGLAIWLVAATALGAAGHFLFGANFWVVAALVLVGLIGNALIIEWEDNRPGGWDNP